MLDCRNFSLFRENAPGNLVVRRTALTVRCCEVACRTWVSQGGIPEFTRTRLPRRAAAEPRRNAALSRGTGPVWGFPVGKGHRQDTEVAKGRVDRQMAIEDRWMVGWSEVSG